MLVNRLNGVTLPPCTAHSNGRAVQFFTYTRIGWAVGAELGETN